MARALTLARRGLYGTHPNPRVGCVIVAGGELVGEGWHERAGGPHAEVVALKAAGSRARGATCYVSLEPCAHHGRTPPCVEALIESGVSRVVCAMTDPNPQVGGRGIALLAAAGIGVDNGLLGADAAALNAGFISRMSRGRPLVRCKLGMSLDGRIAMASGESQWITSVQARRDVQRLRAMSSAVMTGIGTALADDPRLDVRDPMFGETPRQPLRVVVDSDLRLPSAARLLTGPGSALIAARAEALGTPAVLEAAGAEVLRLPAHECGVDLAALLEALAAREINEVLLEAGPTLNGAMLAAGLVDELVLYAAPVLLGNAARGLLSLPGLERLAEAPRLQLKDVRRVGPDLRITAALCRQGIEQQ